MSRVRNVSITCLCLALAAQVAVAQTPSAESATGPALPPSGAAVLQPADRIVFVGDSITGLGERNEGGFVRLIREGLKATHKDSTFELLTLGASDIETGYDELVFSVPGFTDHGGALV